MGTEPVQVYPRGQIAMDSGDLIQVTNVKKDTTNGGKQVHTLRRVGAGVTQGPTETTISFDAVVGEDGEERDYLDMLMKGTIKQIRLKIPGKTMTCNGIVTDESVELPIDDAIKYSIVFKGNLSK